MMTARRGLAVLVGIAMLLAGGNLFAQGPDFAPDRYFVGFNGPISAGDRALLERLGAVMGKAFPEVNAQEVVVRNPAVLSLIERLPRVAYVEQVPMRYKLGLSESQLTPSLTNGLYGLITTKATTVHARGVTGFGINVGVADTGIDYNHPDIAPNYKGGIDTVGVGDDDPFWNNDPNETHGTHVAGTVVAADNSVGVLGVAYNANLYYARVLGPAGGSSADVMEGVRWLVEEANCRVVNLSLGGGAPSLTEAAFYAEMRNLGALIIAASGNDGARRVKYPAAYPSNIAVGAVDVNNEIADFSNTGRQLDLVGPGVLVLSSVPHETGSEASIVAGATFQAFGFEFAGNTTGITQLLVNCGLGGPGECPPSVSGNIALIQRGTHTFTDKVVNAMNAGAVAAIIYNNVPGAFIGTLGTPQPPSGGAWIPAVSASQEAGNALLQQVGAPATVVNIISSWDHFDGTSMATPHVTGVAALVWSADPGLSNSMVEEYLLSTATDPVPTGVDGFNNTYGYGLVNADAAVAKAGK
jgi:subtilisin family serine protease